MKALKLSLVIMAAALLTISLSSMAYAFHNGGVAHCNGCHTMHNSVGGAVMTKAGGAGTGTIGTAANSYLLIGATQSDTCLECHVSASASPASFHVATYPLVSPLVQLSPGGDFSWLQYPSTQAASVKDGHGHNIIAPAYGFNAESTSLGTGAPGGGTGNNGYSKQNLHCTSCHDPHGKYRITDITKAYTTQVTSGAVIQRSSSTPNDITALVSPNVLGTYRLLAGKEYAPVSYPTFPFANAAPVAVAPNTYNRTEASTETRVAYGMGMSEWCANCHGLFHGQASGAPGQELRHPSGASATLTTDVVNNYNHYVTTGNFTGTTPATNPGFPYSSLVPFEEEVDNLNNLRLDAVIDGSAVNKSATVSNSVMCLSCHRAHASGFPHMTRWDISQTLLVDGTGNYSVSGGNAPTDVQKAMYDRAPATAFVAFQRSLCNKCHAKD